MSSVRAVDPYTARYVSLGSGPRERASSCGCNYRTSSTSNTQNSCYTRLSKDPPLSVQRRRTEETMQRNEAPLVRLLMREPIHERILGKTSRRRPFSAAASYSERERHQHPEPTGGGSLIAVKGKNLHCQAKPMGRKASDSFIADRVIESISEATKREVSKLSSFYSNVEPAPLPKPPCSSPVQSETSSFSDEPESDEKLSQDIQRQSPVLNDRRTSIIDQNEEFASFQKADMKSRHGQNLAEALSSADGLRLENLSVDEERAFSLGQRDLEQSCSSSHGNAFLYSKRNGKGGSKMCLQLKIPTADDNDSLPHDNETVNYSCTETDIEDKSSDKCDSTKKNDYRCHNDDKALSENFSSYSKLTKIRDNKIRPVSAYAVMGSTVKAKTIEFIDDKEISGARLMLSNRTLETMLYMDYLQEKERQTREQKEDIDAKPRSTSITSEETAKPRKFFHGRKTKSIDMPPEMQVTSKPPLPRQTATTQHEAEADTASVEMYATSDGSKCPTKSPSEKLASMNERRTALAKKIIRNADTKLEKRKEKQRQEVSFIWRSITGINQTSKETKIKNSHVDLAEERRPNSNVTPGDQVKKVKGSEERENSVLSQIGKASTIDSSMRKMDKITKNPTERRKILSNETVDDDVKHRVRINSEKQVAFSQKTASKNVDSRSRLDNKRILRPTSAVILRFKETMKDNGRTKERPKSSIVKSSTHKSQTAIKQRPTSAAVQRVSARKMPFADVKVASAKNVSFTVKNSESKNYGDQTSISEHKQRKKQRPASAPTKTLIKANSVTLLDVNEEEKKISEECYNVLDAFSKKGIKMSMDTITRALMPPCETAKVYSRTNLPHSSRLLSKPQAWFNE